MRVITIHNLRQEKPQGPSDIRVDRSSPLGNPFKMKDDNRAEVCAQYEQYIRRQIAQRNKKVTCELNRLFQKLKSHGTLRLFCWCAPKQCHAETIRTIILEKVTW